MSRETQLAGPALWNSESRTASSTRMLLDPPPASNTDPTVPHVNVLSRPSICVSHRS